MIWMFVAVLISVYVTVTELFRVRDCGCARTRRCVPALPALEPDRDEVQALEDDVDVPLSTVIEEAEARAVRAWSRNEGRALAALARADEAGERLARGGVILPSPFLPLFPPPGPVVPPGQSVAGELAECRDTLNLIRDRLALLDTGDEAKRALADDLIGRYHMYERRYDMLRRLGRGVSPVVLPGGYVFTPRVDTPPRGI